MSTGYTIHVAGLAPETSETKLHDFFSVSCKPTSQIQLTSVLWQAPERQKARH